MRSGNREFFFVLTDNLGNEKAKVQSKDVNMEELVGNTDGFADSG